jgi:hypothetical protein
MQYLLFFLLLFIWLVVPLILIYRSPSPVGWKKAAWVSGCFLSTFVPAILSGVWRALAVKFGGYEHTLESLAFGQAASVNAMSNIATLVLPWVIYLTFKAKHAKSDP